MLSAKEGALRRRAQKLARRLREILAPSFRISVRPVKGRTGGGSMPTDSIPGVGVGLTSERLSAEQILTRLREGSPPVIARIEQDEVLLDVRTVQKGEDRLIVKAFETAFDSSV
jgi:L-seryl-tRNA(Ser) seleniumtransferase